MLQTMVKVQSFFVSKKGQGLTEYGIIIALVAIVAIAALTGLGTKLKDQFVGITAKLTAE